MVSALRSKFALNEVLPALCMPRSSYQYQVQVEASRRPDKHADLRVRVTEIFRLSKRRYGYRRVWLALRAEGTTVSEKVVCRIMKGGVPVAKRGKRRKYSSYRGEIAEVPDNLVKREFRVDAPNKLWLTDVTEFRIPAGKVYPCRSSTASMVWSSPGARRRRRTPEWRTRCSRRRSGRFREERCRRFARIADAATAGPG